MTNYCHNRMKITGAAEEIARFKQACIRIVSDGEPPQLDFDAIIPMPEIVRDARWRSGADDGLIILGYAGEGLHTLDCADLAKTMLEWDWVKEAGVTDVEQLKALLLRRDPECVDKARQCLKAKEQTGYFTWYDWARANWGTKGNAGHFDIIQDDPHCFEVAFDTAWSPPVPVWEKIGEMFPALEFDLSGCEPLGDFAFRGTIHGGKRKLRDVATVWETIDPKTGEVVQGTREEIAKVLGHEIRPVNVGVAAEDDA